MFNSASDRNLDFRWCRWFPTTSTMRRPEARSGSKLLEASDLHGFFLQFFWIEFWGARLGDGVASGAPGDRTSRRPCGGWRGWEALGAVIPRVGGHRGPALDECDKSWILTWCHQFAPRKVTRSGGPPLKSANLGTSPSNSPKVSKWGCHKGQLFWFRKLSNYKPDRIVQKMEVGGGWKLVC